MKLIKIEFYSNKIMNYLLILIKFFKLINRKTKSLFNFKKNYNNWNKIIFLIHKIFKNNFNNIKIN